MSDVGSEGSALDERLIELETRVSYQEGTLQQLNEVVTEQDSYIQSLQVQVQSLAKKLEEMSQVIDQPTGKVGNEPPPHY